MSSSGKRLSFMMPAMGTISSLGGRRNALLRGRNGIVRNPFASAVERAEKLQGRLEEQIIFEIVNDGGSTFKNLNVRDLYTYVVDAITTNSQTTLKCARPNALRATVKLRTSFMKQSNRILSTGISNRLLNPLHEDTDDDDDDDDDSDSSDKKEKKKTIRFGNDLDEFPKKKRNRKNPIEKQEEEEEEEEVTYRERLGGYLHPRDVRKLYTPFSASDEPEIIVRRHVLLLNFDSLRAIILRDRLLVFVPQGADSILEDLENKVRNGVGSTTRGNNVSGDAPGSGAEALASRLANKKKSFKGKKNTRSKSKNLSDDKTASTEETSERSSSVADLSVNGEDEDDYFHSEWDELKKGEGWMVDLPFELRCIDAVLETVTSIFKEDTDKLLDEAEGNILHVRNSRSLNTSLLRQDKDTLTQMSSRVAGFSRAINLILDNNEDMALMNISRLITHPERFIQPVPEAILNEEADEPELILEAHLQATNTLTNELDLLKNIIATTQEEMNQRSGTVRNRLLYAEMVISIVSLNVALASLVGSYMGMNVTNGIENDEAAFLQIVIGTSIGAFLLIFALLLGLLKSGVLPSMNEL